MTLAGIALAVSLVSLMLTASVMVYLKKTSFSTLSQFTEDQRAAYAALRHQQKQNSASDAKAIVAMQADLSFLKDSLIELKESLESLQAALKASNMTLLRERWLANNVAKRRQRREDKP